MDKRRLKVISYHNSLYSQFHLKSMNFKFFLVRIVPVFFLTLKLQVCALHFYCTGGGSDDQLVEKKVYNVCVKKIVSFLLLKNFIFYHIHMGVKKKNAQEQSIMVG